MIKDFEEILIVKPSEQGRIVLDHQRRWVFRILARRQVNISHAQSLFPDSGDINLRVWSDFLIQNGIEIIYDIRKQKLLFIVLPEKDILGYWREPELVRSKLHPPGHNVLLFKYSEPV